MKFNVRIYNLLAVMIVGFSIQSIAAEVINLPQDELARESVLPKFEDTVAVKNKKIIEAKKMEFGVYYGFNITEPIYNQGKYGFNLGYHLSEGSDLSVNYAKWLGGKNTLYTNDLEQNYGLNFGRIPPINYSLYIHYAWDLFYGKISLTKHEIMRLNIYPIVGIGTTDYDKNYFGVDAGIGMKFFFTKSLALRTDLKLQYQQQPSPFLGSTTHTTPGIANSDPVPGPNDFQKVWEFNNILDVGLTYLF